jgi:uncharacterized protein involved in exopolysaccharide biosynthesis
VPPFGTTVDPVEAGRKGGQASAVSRKLRKQRELEAKVAESRNGYAILKLAEREARRNEALEEALRRARAEAEREAAAADYGLTDLLDEQDAVKQELAKLDEQVAALRAKAETPEGLAELLRELPADHVDRALELTGLFERGEDEAA